MKTLEAPPGNRLLFQNDSCLVLNKLPGESSEFPNLDGVGAAPVHRLDTPVSGCLLLAKDKAAAAFLGQAFARPGGVEKRYWAVIEKPKPEGVFAPEAELVHWLFEDRKANKSFAVPAIDQTGNETPPPKWGPVGGHIRPKKAVLRYRLAGTGDNYLFLEIDLVTGRHHQIRAQLAAIGLHVKGDLKYGAKRSERAGGIRLHAHALAFPDPLTPAEIIKVTAPPPLMDPLWAAFAASLDK